ncbi:MAG: hypothetical protein GF329_18235 [Candidatus Lokiarchaeota archaeon]|nr:hypothetical protein [Candidatus Lokiarchaeota archaeon]
MNNKRLKINQLVTMKQFEGGWIWLKNIKLFSQKAVNAIEDKMNSYEIKKISDIIKGVIINDWKIYDDTKWVISIETFPDSYILIIYNKNEEFGSEIRLFFNKHFLETVPTEDAYCFIELYLKTIVSVIEHPEITTTKISGDILSIDELLEIVDKKNKEKLKNEILEIRKKVINKIPDELMIGIAEKLNAKYVEQSWSGQEIHWGLIFEPLSGVKINYTYDQDGFQIYYTMMALKFEARDVLFFTWLYCNAIIREARKIMGENLPKLSKYL